MQHRTAVRLNPTKQDFLFVAVVGYLLSNLCCIVIRGEKEGPGLSLVVIETGIVVGLDLQREKRGHQNMQNTTFQTQLN